MMKTDIDTVSSIHHQVYDVLELKRKRRFFGDKNAALIELTPILAMRTKGGAHVRRECR